MVDASKVTAFITALTNKFENKTANKKDSITGDFSSDSASYPTVKAVKNFFGSKITAWGSTPSDSNYPSEKLVKGALDTKISKSSTSGLIKNDGSVDTNVYITSSSLPTKTSDLTNDGDDGTNVFVKNNDSRLSNARTPTSHTHGDITNDGKIGTASGKPIITTTNGKLSAGSFGTSSGTFCEGNDSRLSDARTPISHTHGSVTNDGKIGTASGKIITTGTSGVLQASDSITKSQISDFPSTMTPSSHTHGDITNDGKLGSTANKPLITTTGGKITAGSFGTSANTFCQGNDSRLSDARTPTAHNQASTTIVEASALANIGTSANATQSEVNSAVNTALGNLQNLKAIRVVDTKPTASADTMDKLYIVSEDSKVNVYYTTQSGSTYTWHKMDTDILDEYSINWNDVQNKPSTFTPSSHAHGNITNDGKVGSTSGKPLITTTGGAVTAGAFGTSSGQFAEGNHTHNYTTTSDVDTEIEAYLDAITTALTS